VSQSAVSIYASLFVFIGTYIAISIVRRHRTVIAIAGATVMIILGSSLSFYHLPEVIAAIDFDAIAILLGMMVVANMFGKTGLVQYAALKGAKLAGGRPVPLFVYLGAAIFAASMVLGGTTAILIAVPVTASLADIIGITALPFLVGEVILARIGGMATMIGNAGNVVLGSAGGPSFRGFLAHAAPIAIVVGAMGMGLLLPLFRRALRQRPSNVEQLAGIEERGAITDPRKGQRILLVLGGTLLLFLVHDLIGLTPGMVAMLGAAGALIALRPDFDAVLKEVRWDILLFFISLFVIVGGLEASGGFAGLASGLSIALLWGTAAVSSAVGPVPFAIAILPGIAGSAPLFWAVVIGIAAGGVLIPFRSERTRGDDPLPLPLPRYSDPDRPLAEGRPPGRLRPLRGRLARPHPPPPVIFRGMTIRIDSWLELVDVEQFGVPGRGAAYLVQGEGLALIETGTARSAAILRAALRGRLRAALRGRDLRFIFVTHIHLDHAGGAGYIAADHPEATVVVASPRAIPHLIDPTRLIRGVREASRELFPLYGEPGPIPEERLHPASNSEVFDLGGGIAIEAVNSPGHAPHHVSFFERSHRYLFTGDALGNYALPVDLPLTVPPRFDLEKGLATLTRFARVSPPSGQEGSRSPTSA